ncbi:hypothetical protein B0J11DRAFT_593496 [Dendryphion nanum]|uniref:NACHT domain-containing protein n=1 Tax=Dendryphion nanum TaxID=256645 RepID=A0A9P9DAU6_9PLEO|nr:hypothetical protein B0J11DRAFT_593496 [Dendryphion nanum]
MAEAIGAVASVLTIIEATVKVIKTCKELVETTREAPRDICHVLVEISSLKAALESLEFLSSVDCDSSHGLRRMVSDEGAVRSCGDTVEQLANELSKLTVSVNSQHSLRASHALKKSLQWYLKQTKVSKLLDEAVQHKSTITVNLLGEVTRDVKDVKRTVHLIHNKLSQQQLQDTCRWLEVINPSQDHNNARALHDDQTTRWITRLDKYNMWLAGSNRFVWIHGIPGAGKTILMSEIIHKTLAYCEEATKTSPRKFACTYYYCSYRHTNDDTMSFVRWIICRLSLKLESVPSNILELFRENLQPNLKQCKPALASLLEKTSTVYLLLDAVDECNTRDDLLAFLSELAVEPEFAGLRVLVSSREYLDIQEALGSNFTPISMSNPMIDSDIRTYITSTFGSKPAFRRWSPGLLADAKDALVRGARGMFRWVTCQLFVLGRKRSEEDVRMALKQLPETLDETYERIFLAIPSEDWLYVRKVLIFICAHIDLPFHMDIPTVCLKEAIVYGTSGEHFIDQDTLYEMCGCLISEKQYEKGKMGGNVLGLDDSDERRVAFSTTSLSHYTVREFLYSDRIRRGPVSFFALSDEETTREFLQIVMPISTTVDREILSPRYYEDFESYCCFVTWIVPEFWESRLVNDDLIWRILCVHLNRGAKAFGILDDPFLVASNNLDVYLHDHEPAYAYVDVWEPSSADDDHWVSMFACLIESELFVIAARYAEEHYCDDFLVSTSLRRPPGPGSQTGVLGNPMMIWKARGQESLIEKTIKILTHRVDPEALLSIRVATHLPRYCRFCVEKQLSKKQDGNIPNDKNYELECSIQWLIDQVGEEAITRSNCLVLTHLQTAVSNCDFEATHILLEAGAHPNEVGVEDGIWLPHFSFRWIGRSCLNIVRCLKEDRASLDDPDSKLSIPRIEQLLIEFGAEDLTFGEQGGSMDV